MIVVFGPGFNKVFVICVCNNRKHFQSIFQDIRVKTLIINSFAVSIYIKLQSLFGCFLLVCPIITQEPLDRFNSNLDWGTRETQYTREFSWLGFEILS